MHLFFTEMLNHLAGATIEVANLVNYDRMAMKPVQIKLELWKVKHFM